MGIITNHVDSVYKNANGVYITRSLFLELSYDDPSNVLYTLKNHDVEHKGKTIPSLFKLYMEIGDPTEWKVANECFDGWEHWELLTNSTFFKPYIESWRYQLELRMKSESLARIKSEAKSSSREALAANKYLLEKKWVPAEASKRGRPTKEAIKREADLLSKDDEEILGHDLKRFGLH